MLNEIYLLEIDKKIYLNNQKEVIYFNNKKYLPSFQTKEINISSLTYTDNAIEIIIFNENILSIIEDLKNKIIIYKLIIDSMKNIISDKIIYRGVILSCINNFSNHIIILNVISIFKNFMIQHGEFYSVNCRAKLGDQKCNINLNNFTHSGIILEIIDNKIIFGNHKIFDIDYFDFGTFIINDEKYQVINETNGKIELNRKLNNIKIGDSYKIIAGCNKNWKTCKEKFKNTENFRGEPYIEI